MPTVTFTTLHARELFAPVLPVVKAVEDIYPSMQFAQVCVTPKSVHVYATDRYVLVESRQQIEGNNSGEMYVPLDAVAVLAKARGSEIVTYECNGTPATLTLTSGQSWRFDVPTGYPNIAGVCDAFNGATLADNNEPFSASVPVLDTILRVAKAAGKDTTPVFQGTKDGKGLRVVRMTYDVRALVAPARKTADTEGTDMFPYWESVESVQRSVRLAAVPAA